LFLEGAFNVLKMGSKNFSLNLSGSGDIALRTGHFALRTGRFWKNPNFEAIITAT